MIKLENTRAVPEMITENLRLRKCGEKDVEEFYRLAGNPNVTKYVRWECHKTIEETASYVNNLEDGYVDGSCTTWAVCGRGSNLFMGLISLSQISEKNFSAEAGFWLGEEYWNKGYTTEALKAVVDFGLRGSLNLHRIHARHFVDHLACGRVLQKAGMIFEGVERGSVYCKGNFYDVARYAVIKQ